MCFNRATSQQDDCVNDIAVDELADITVPDWHVKFAWKPQVLLAVHSIILIISTENYLISFTLRYPNQIKSETFDSVNGVYGQQFKTMHSIHEIKDVY